jgi:hypothetical protein
MSNVVGDTAPLVYRLLCSSLWVEISTQAYESNSCCCPARFPLAYCTHIIQTKVMLKNRKISTKIDVYSYMRAHRRASCSAGVICRGCGVVTFNTVVNLLKPSSAPSNSWNSHSFHIVALDLFCCLSRRHSNLSRISFVYRAQSYRGVQIRQTVVGAYCNGREKNKTGRGSCQ